MSSPATRLGLVRFRRDQVSERPVWLPWSLRAIVLRDPARVMVGYANFHGPPGVNDLGTPDAAETGYTVFEPTAAAASRPRPRRR